LHKLPTETRSNAGIDPVPENIPNDIKAYDHWVVFKFRPKPDGKLGKIPYNPATCRRASHSDSRTWTTFDKVWAEFESGKWDGIGFAFSSGDPFVGIDFDNCRDPETAEIEDWAREILESFENAVHVEVSPSGRGIHLITRGQLTKGFNRDQVEMYAQCRFFTVTGRVL
jgi:putative DNA primase/helicase